MGFMALSYRDLPSAAPPLHAWRGLSRAGGVAAFLLLAYCAATMVQFWLLGGPPQTAAAAFALLHDNPLIGLLRLDLPTVLAMPLYYPLFLGLYATLRKVLFSTALLSTLLAFMGTTLVLATPTALSLLPLSRRFHATASDLEKTQLLAAGEAILASDIWRGTGAILGGLLLQVACVLISFVMLQTRAFPRITAWTGIVTHSLDLLHILAGLVLPAAGAALMALASPLYFLWFPLVGLRLLQLARH
jgi:hypothetical protein